jgi:5-formyltetrahydrofolate cyclo-ligase
MTTKPSLRAAARRHRATLTRADYAQTIARYADDLALAPGAIVAGYFPFRDEADPRLLMEALHAKGHPLALPCVASGQPLTFRAWTMGDAMHPNTMSYNIPEPSASAPAVTPDLILVPLLAFDAQGHRLGYGGGYYDRTLALLTRDAMGSPASALRRAASRRGSLKAIGVAYAGQEIAALPREDHDHPLDAVITENGLRRFR